MEPVNIDQSGFTQIVVIVNTYVIAAETGPFQRVFFAKRSEGYSVGTEEIRIDTILVDDRWYFRL